MRRALPLAILALACGLSGPLVAAPLTAAKPGLVVEETTLRPDGSTELDTLIVRPPGPGPFPLLVISHGGASDGTLRASANIESYRWPAEEFARRGYAVVFALRPGYGRSKGQVVEGAWRCTAPEAAAMADSLADGIRRTIDAANKLPYVDGTRVVVVGHSLGGLGALALHGADLPGLKAVISFAGGIAGDQSDCDIASLSPAFAGLGKTSGVPSLWIFSDNDSVFSPEVAQRFLSAFASAGGKAELRAMPSFGNEGHNLFQYGVPQWRPAVVSFLQRVGMPIGMVQNQAQIARAEFPAFWAQAMPQFVSECSKTGAPQADCTKAFRCAGTRLAQSSPNNELASIYEGVVKGDLALGDQQQVALVLRSCQ